MVHTITKDAWNFASIYKWWELMPLSIDRKRAYPKIIAFLLDLVRGFINLSSFGQLE